MRDKIPELDRGMQEHLKGYPRDFQKAVISEMLEIISDRETCEGYRIDYSDPDSHLVFAVAYHHVKNREGK